MESISGTVIRVLKRDEDTGNAFLVVRYESMGGLVEAKMGCRARDLKEGDWFCADGQWRTNLFRGRTEEIFNAKQVRPDLPSTKEGAQAFFARIFNAETHGVTPDLVRRFVAVHGDKAARAAEANPDILLQMSARPGECREAIMKEWGRRVSGRKAVSLMERSGVEDKAITNILEAFRDSTWDVLNSNPYKVCRVRDVGFSNADKIGRSMGVADDDSRRLAAALHDVLIEAGGEGDTYVQLRRILDTVSQRLKVQPERVKDFLTRSVSDGNSELVVDKIGDALVAQLPELFRAEAYVAKTVARMLANGPRRPDDKVEAVVRRVLGQSKFSKIDPVQRSAVVMAAREPFSILTGGPGTGKSTIMAAVVEAAEALGDKDIFLVAPTGKASKRLAETTRRNTLTVHRLLRAREDVAADSSIFGLNRANPLPPGAFVVVDEASMVDAEMMAAILDAMPEDARLLLVGDRFQLPSVGPGYVLGDLLSARLENGSQAVPSVELTQVYRQDRNSAIASGAAMIKNGEVPYLDNKVRGGLVLFEYAANEISDKIMALVSGPLRTQLGFDPRRDVAVLAPQAPGKAGTWDLNRRLSALLNPSGAVIEGIFHGPSDDKQMPLPRIGDKVMLTENDDENDVFNGDVGILEDVVTRDDKGRPKRFLRVAFEGGKTVEYPLAQWRKLVLAYAGTIHKSQGSQYKCVILPVTLAHERMLERHLIYTGWTRAESLLVLIGEREAIKKAAAVAKSTERRTRLPEFLAVSAADFGLRVTQRTTESSAPAARPAAPGGLPGAFGLLGRRLAPPRAAQHEAEKKGTEAGSEPKATPAAPPKTFGIGALGGFGRPNRPQPKQEEPSGPKRFPSA